MWKMLALLLPLAGCSMVDRNLTTKFEPQPEGRWLFVAPANLTYPLDTGEPTRMAWLKYYMDGNNACPGGYRIAERRPVVIGTTFGTAYRVFYTVECATAAPPA